MRTLSDFSPTSVKVLWRGPAGVVETMEQPKFIHVPADETCVLDQTQVWNLSLLDACRLHASEFKYFAV